MFCEKELWKYKQVFWPDSYKNTKTALSTLAPDILEAKLISVSSATKGTHKAGKTSAALSLKPGGYDPHGDYGNWSQVAGCPHPGTPPVPGTHKTIHNAPFS